MATQTIATIVFFLSNGMQVKRLGGRGFQQMVDGPEQFIVQRLGDVGCDLGRINIVCFPCTNTLLIENHAELGGPLCRHLSQDRVRRDRQLCRGQKLSDQSGRKGGWCPWVDNGLQCQAVAVEIVQAIKPVDFHALGNM